VEQPLPGGKVLKSIHPGAFFPDSRKDEAFRLPHEALDDGLERTFLSYLIRALGLPEPEELIVESGIALMVQKAQEAALFAKAFRDLESYNASESFRVEARVILVEPAKLPVEVLGYFSKKNPGVSVTRKAMDRILESPGAEVFPLPPTWLTPYALTRRLSVEEFRYVRDYDVSILCCGNVDQAFPIYGRLHEGLSLAFRTIRLPDRRLFCQARVFLAQIPRPIPRFHTTLGGKSGRPVSIDLPEILTSGGTFHFHPAEGTTFLVSLGKLVEGEGVGKRKAALAVTVRR
jgi:hypothetical protein